MHSWRHQTWTSSVLQRVSAYLLLQLFLVRLFWLFLAEGCNCIASSAVVIRCLLSVCLSSVCLCREYIVTKRLKIMQFLLECSPSFNSLPAKFDDEIQRGSHDQETQTGVSWFSIDFATLYLRNGAR